MSNIVESFWLLEPDACAASDKNGEIETAVYGEIVEMKQDRIIPIFRCHVIEMIISQHCGHRSSVGVTQFIRFRETKGMKASQNELERRHGGPHDTNDHRSHAVFLSGGMDSSSNCEAGVTSP
jgi:hypothetical protein